MRHYFKNFGKFFAAIFLLASFVAVAADTFVVEIKLENHVFTPDIIKVPEGVKVKLIIHNMDNTMEEFDSPSLKREKILRSKSKTNIILAPLKKGRYEFIGEFHEATAKGAIIVE